MDFYVFCKLLPSMPSTRIVQETPSLYSILDIAPTNECHNVISLSFAVQFTHLTGMRGSSIEKRRFSNCRHESKVDLTGCSQCCHPCQLILAYAMNFGTFRIISQTPLIGTLRTQLSQTRCEYAGPCSSSSKNIQMLI